MNLGSIDVFVVALVLTPFCLASRWSADLGWCRSTTNDHLFQGDFNGDGRTDLLCHRTTTGFKWIALADTNGRFSGTSWSKDLGWCRHAGAELHVGDFNGDGKDDMLCHDTITGYKWIAHANLAGNFTAGTTWRHALRWCRQSGAELHIGDFNGDGKDDMLCHDSSDGRKLIAFANAAGNFVGGTSWNASLGWCRHSGAELFVGDFNGDRKDDLLCHDSNDGRKWIAFANDAGNFDGGSDWSEAIGWCIHNGAELHIGDSDGDGRDDLFCHDTNDGRKWVARSNCQGNFHDRTTWRASLGWCRHGSAQFFLGDYNGDSRTDMLCHDTSSGMKWVIYAGVYE